LLDEVELVIREDDEEVPLRNELLLVRGELVDELLPPPAIFSSCSGVNSLSLLSLILIDY
jgi:hypothetical protein